MQEISISLSKPLDFPFPTLLDSTHITEQISTKIKIVKFITQQEIPQFIKSQKNQSKLKKNLRVNIEDQNIYYVLVDIPKLQLDLKNTIFITATPLAQNKDSIVGVISVLLCSTYQFKIIKGGNKKIQPIVYYDQNIQKINYSIQLAKSRSYSRQLANQRGNIASTYFMQNQCKQIALQNNLQITVIKDQDLIKNRFYLLQAVGRASKSKPIFVNLAYRGAPNSNMWIAFVGKGLCFDSGGLSIKTSTGMIGMHLDKHGSTSVLSALRTIAKLKLKVNITASFGFAQNSINQNAYRPSDIIESRNGLTVQIGNTDAQGRLTLADVMDWTQEKYKPTHLIQLSTLTGAIITALGKTAAGLFSNNIQLVKNLTQAGNFTKQPVWHLPISQQHRNLVVSKYADLTNSSGKSDGSSSQAAAFLQAFVHKDVKWAHIDIAGTAMNVAQGTGYGAKLLIRFAEIAQNWFNQKNQ